MSFKKKLTKKKRALLSGITSEDELILLSQDRSKKKIEWARKNLWLLERKYKGVPLLEKVFSIIYVEHLSSNRDDFKLTYVTPDKLQILSRNFCPYLEACNDLNLDTRYICKIAGEQSFRDLASEIDKDVLFYRNYENIRPYTDFCEEYLEFINPMGDLDK